MAGIRNIWVRAALIVSLLLPVWFLVGAFGTRFGVLDWRVGFGLMTFKLGPLLLMGSLGLAAIALLLSLAVPPRGRGWVSALIALLIPAAGLGYGVSVQQAAKNIPPIHDISTDLADPPTFSAEVAEARAKVPGGNGLDLLGARLPDAARLGPLAGKAVVDVQRQAYGDIKSLFSDTPAIDTFQVALDAAQAQRGWIIDRNDPATGIIEARATSFWYGFTDDIVVRVRALPDGSGSVVDVRSVSRVGLSDLGANAKRVRAYLAALNTRLGEAATGG